MMNWLDTDADGQISRAELESANQARLAGELKAFDTADLNQDSKLSRNEMKAFRDAMRAEGGLGGRGCAAGGPGGSGAPGGRPPAPPAKPAA
jgi:Ca2+-binding EF-hand superfamily protein